MGVRRAAVILAVVAAAGCTTSPSEERAVQEQAVTAAYSPAYAEISDEYRQAMTTVQDQGRTALQSSDDQAVLDTYRSLRDATLRAADALEGVEVPAGLQGRHASLVDNLRLQGEALDGVVEGAEQQHDGEVTSGLSELTSLLVDFTTISAAIEQELAQGQ